MTWTYSSHYDLEYASFCPESDIKNIKDYALYLYELNSKYNFYKRLKLNKQSKIIDIHSYSQTLSNIFFDKKMNKGECNMNIQPSSS